MSFTTDIQKFTKKAGGNINRLVKDVVFELGKGVVENSIVGDANYWKSKPPKGYVGGRFRGNWQHGIGTMPLDKFDTTENISIQRIEGTLPEKAGGLIHWIVNNVPYSIALENGTASKRTPPQGIVGRTVLRFDEIVANAARNIR